MSELTIPGSRPSQTRRPRAKKAAVLGFSLPERLFILAVDDERGAIEPSHKEKLRFGLAAAFLAELALAKRIEMRDDRLFLADAAPSEDTLLDGILELIAAEEKPHKLVRWLEIIGKQPIIKQTAVRLQERHVINIEEKRYFWVIPYEVYPQVDASAKYWVKQRLRDIVLAAEAPSPADVTLLGLVKACNLLRLVFTRDERKSAAKKVELLAQGDIFSEATAKVLAEIETALMNSVL